MEQPVEQERPQYDWKQDLSNDALKRTICMPSLYYHISTYGDNVWKDDYVRYNHTTIFLIISIDFLPFLFQILQLLYALFKPIGEINSIRLIGNHRNIGHIEFTNNQIASKLISKRGIQMENAKITIEPADVHSQSIPDFDFEQIPTKEIEENLLLRAPETDSPNNILNALNDDCLREIFEKFETLSMLHSISNVCVRFSEIAKQIFKTKHRHRFINMLELRWNNQLNLPQIIPFLRKFGSSIESLNIKCEFRHFKTDYYEDLPLSSYFLKIINKYCKNLTFLCITIFDLDSQTLAKIYPLLSRLKGLQLELSSFSLLSDFISACSQLETLSIVLDRPTRGILPGITLPKLSKFELTGNIIVEEEVIDSLDLFLACNPHLEHIRIDFCSKSICHYIGRNMPKLREITLHNERSDAVLDLEHMYDLKLKYCSYRIIAPHIHQLLENNVLIEELAVNVEILDKVVIDNICQLKSVEKLTIRANNLETDNNYLIKLARNLPHLKKLKIWHSVLEMPDANTTAAMPVTIAMIIKMLSYATQLSELTFDSYRLVDIAPYNKDDYNTILEAIKRRIDHKKLRIKFKIWRMDGRFDEGIQPIKYMVMDMEPDLLIFEHVFSPPWSQREFFHILEIQNLEFFS